ncbi:SDR family NAD(P)-dependent oxidoreductase [Tolypothrix sp. FACHB-123]|uniref:type I polyketide synthase n=1 Tax=Tolypothrix sp. FACHB-123 TaxID=2692868 RepID=UPI0016853A9C|nr:type I polyketide synthase [Tolypothrix sp. FACHB-123]MBD2355236.1 SDR family NAD(P)-dependent oxidoreductase [Tolypothrix sp. FACHB-123]
MSESIEEIAIIGMAGRFPGAKNIAEFWQNLSSGVESISYFTNEELTAAGINSSFLKDKNYVKSGCILEDIELFDAAFFDINPKEAETTDPQHRLFLECAYTALENAGYDSTRCKERIGVYAGASHNNYLTFDLNKDSVGSVTCYQTSIGNDKDYLATRLSYKLNLTGPSLTIQTACSTSLVSITLACQSLLNYQCDMALAGGVSIHIPQKTGYLHEPGGTLSPDGHCYAFDAKAQGITIGNGLGVVVLKRLSEAVADGDYIYAVIKGAAINNDGAAKVGFTAPSVDGQAEAIAEAMILAEVEPDTISYIETHGTGTALGDPIEIAALTKVFRAHTEQKGFCAIGSVKTNIGHLDAAAGVAGLIKTVLALQHQQIPPSLNFDQPNPKIDFANSPFYVNTKLTQWKPGFTPRRAGVSSLGMGGTNAHVILEEAPFLEEGKEERKYKLLLLSAKMETALETATTNLLNHLQQHPEINIADVAYTLQVGRREFKYRRMLVCKDTTDAVNALNTAVTRYQESGHRAIAFMFPGQGSQYVDMGKELYQTEAIFQEQVDLCCQLLQPHLGLDLRSVIYPQENESPVAEKLQQTAIAQPALFVIEYALAKLWMSWGISPSAMIGHSIGEYVAACLAGVFSLEDALALVARRGRLMQQLPAGAMLAISQSAAEVQSLLNENLSLAASNAPSSCVVSGTHDAIDAIQARLTALGVDCRRLHTSHAFHSGMMEPILEPFTKEVHKIKLNPPQFPFISNVTGTWITAQQATDPNYWGRHLRQTVQFSAGISTLLQEPNYILLEVGPGRSLGTLAKKHSHSAALCSLPHPREKQSDIAFLLNSVGKLWLYGVQIDWSKFYSGETRHRLPLPTYPFERQRYWIEQERPKSEPLAKKADIDDWFYVPLWKQSIINQKQLINHQSCTLIFIDEIGLGEEIAKRLQLEGQDVIIVQAGVQFTKLSDRAFSLNPKQRSDYDALVNELIAQNQIPTAIAHLWNVTSFDNTPSGIAGIEQLQDKGFYSLLFLAQAIGKQHITSQLQITVVSNNMQSVIGEDCLYPEKATLLGAVKIIPQEYPNISCRSIDIAITTNVNWQNEKFIENLLQELKTPSSDIVIAYRGVNRWVQTFESVRLEKQKEISKLKPGGVYLITGGLGGMGLALASHLAKAVQAKLVLIGRSYFPEKSEWEQWLTTHDAEDNISQKIRKLQEIEDFGAEVLALSADVSNLEQMQKVFATVQEKFPQINGIIHCAGVPDYAGVISRRTREMTEKIMAPKVKGTLVLNSLLKDIQLDFLILCSSLSSIIYRSKFSEVGYCAANEFLDAFAYYKAHRENTFTVAINWNDWLDVGMSIEAVKRIVKKYDISQEKTLLADAVIPSEGVEVFERVLNSTSPQIAISTQDLTSLIEHDRNFDPQAMLASLGNTNTSKPTHARPQLTNAYVAPRNETEKIIAEVWQQLLGIEEVGIYDNFFELGGDSLLIVKVQSQLQKRLQRDLFTTDLFEYPTINALAQYLSQEDVDKTTVQQAQSRAKRQEKAIEEEKMMKQRRKARG